MDRMKTFFKYGMWIVLFFIFSELMINVGLNSSYKDMEIKSDGEGNSEYVTINQAQATRVNGRIKGTVTNSGDEDLNGKYVKVDIYSERDVLLGSKYQQIQNLGEGQSQPFEVFFKSEYAKYFKTSIVDEVPEGKLFDFSSDKLEFLNQELSKPDIILAVLIALILW